MEIFLLLYVVLVLCTETAMKSSLRLLKFLKEKN